MNTFRQHIIRRGERILSWFSCGAASACATKLALDVFDADHPVIPIYCDTSKSEHPDNLRFIADCEKWFGVPIKRISNPAYSTVEDVFEARQYMAGIKGAVCTGQLKKVPRFNFALPDDIHIFGFTADEAPRILKFEANNPDMNLLWILRDHGRNKASCFQTLIDAGIELPAMYLLGFENNNCPGCVKVSSPWYWDKIRHHFPEVYRSRCEQSRRLGVRLVEISHHVRIFLDELPAGPFKKYGKQSFSCGPECASPEQEP